MQELLGATYSDGRPLADELIINMILALTWAGHETTAAQVSWVLVQLLQDPAYLRRWWPRLIASWRPKRR